MLTACYEDHSTIAGSLIPDIAISGFAEGGYSIVSFADNTLDIQPVVTTEYPADQLSYQWYLIDNQALSVEGDNYKPTLIAETPELHYNVQLSPGNYTIYLKVQAANGYSVTQSTSLFATTPFSKGFYILKETIDGQTEIDLAEVNSGTFLQDVLTSVHGSPLEGAPEAISTTINQGFIDDDTHQTSVSNVLTVTTKRGQISVMRTSDLKEVFRNDNILFTHFDEGEVPYKIVQCMWSNVLISNKGVRSQYQSDLDKGDSGKYGITNGIPTSPLAAFEPNSSCLFLWDDTNNNVVVCDYNGTARYGSREENNLGTMNAYTCQLIGYNSAADRIVYVLRSKTNILWVMTISGSFGSGWKVEEMMPIKALAPNCSRASRFALCAVEATVLYGVADGQIWAYDFQNLTEKQIFPAGIPDDETITYVSDQSNNMYSRDNDYLIIGTEKGDNYTLRFYRNFGGLPDGEPVYVVVGKGKVKGIRFTTNSAASYNQGMLMD